MFCTSLEYRDPGQGHSAGFIMASAGIPASLPVYLSAGGADPVGAAAGGVLGDPSAWLHRQLLQDQVH
jgi:hypothetical protein